MKKTLLIIFLLFVVKFQAQENKGFSFDISGGITAPLGDYKTFTKTFAENGMGFIGFTEEITGKAQFNFGASYQFDAFGAGFNIGIFKHEISSLTYEIDFPILLQGGEIDGIFYGIGPDYKTSFGDFSFSALLRGGLMDVSLDKFTGSYNGADTDQPIEILSTELAPGSKTSLPYTSLGVKFSYQIYQGLSVFVKGEYLTTFGDGIEILDTYYTPFDADNDGIIGIDDVNQFVNIEYLEEDLRFLKPQMLNFGLGFSYAFGNPKDESNMSNSNDVEEQIIETENETETDIVTQEALENETQEDCRPKLKIENKGNIIPKGEAIKFASDIPKTFKGNKSVSVYLLSKEADFLRKDKINDNYIFLNPNPVSGNEVAMDQAKRSNKKVGEWNLKAGNGKGQYSTVVETDKLEEGTYVAFVGDMPCVSSPVVFSITAGCNSEIEVSSISKCQGVDEEGNYIYNICLTYTNTNTSTSISFNDPLNFTKNNVTQVVEVIGAGSISGITPGLPATILPGMSVQVCFTLTTNQTNANFWVFGLCLDGIENTNHPNTANDMTGILDLKPCLCNYCDTVDWTITDGSIVQWGQNKKLLKLNVGTITIPGVSVNSFKAEIVNFEHWIDGECMTCNKNIGNYGKIISGKITANNWNTIQGTYPLLPNGNTSHNTIEFYKNGINATFGGKGEFIITTPEISSLSCCGDTITICVRYSFTDKECRSCSKVVCYKLERTNK